MVAAVLSRDLHCEEVILFAHAPRLKIGSVLPAGTAVEVDGDLMTDALTVDADGALADARIVHFGVWMQDDDGARRRHAFSAKLETSRVEEVFGPRVAALPTCIY